MSQKQGPPLPGQNDWPTHFLSGCSSLVNLSAAAFLSALTTAIPGASNIETQHMPDSRPLWDCTADGRDTVPSPV